MPRKTAVVRVRTRLEHKAAYESAAQLAGISTNAWIDLACQHFLLCQTVVQPEQPNFVPPQDIPKDIPIVPPLPPASFKPTCGKDRCLRIGCCTCNAFPST